ncbi:type IX secretion system protein PorD [Maribacter sp. 1_2014MBL_MicDiv]|uniref:type IX secretion system protein PorD n=1 Tax=Maribacter sp. 1_2014MBL_MicDiv TaxID=1644130 RepID=UPI0008F4A769|nr:DUF4835 family protein [Maribacter sp. 1_2014MBL_MicDiv]APA66470.1 hypothetical protein YQ22_18640 [Maribacter sp. 1_2014MBL_MicDiv]
MRKAVFLFFFNLFCFVSIAQELNCVVTVNSDQLTQGDLQVFKTLERSLNDFINKSKWTNRVYKENERVNAQMFITITSYESNVFSGNIQIQSSRPVYNTSYSTPVFNYKDNDFNFQYIEFQPLIFNENQFESNLVSVMAYYAYVILGLDADTFSLEGGTDFYRRAQNIVTQAQGSNSAGWSQSADSNRSRFELIDNLLSNTYREYRIAMYNYHRKGLDILPDNNSTGKQVIAGTMNLFQTMINRRPNAFLISTFFDAKSEEIKNIFSDGPKVDIVKLKETLNKIAPLYATTWNDIKY